MIERKTLSELYSKSNLRFDEVEIDDIQCAFPDKNAICISTSDFYVKYASLLLLSILDHASDEHNYDIVILTTDMSIENQIIIKKLSSRQNVCIRILDISSKIEDLNFYTWAHFTPNTYYRLSIPTLLKAYSKVLYLDSDTIVNRDVHELFEYDINDYFLAAAKDTHVLSYCNGLNPEQYEYNRDVLKLNEPTDYFQMGVSIFNIQKIRAEYHKDLLEVATTVKYKWLDQDILNVQFEGKIYELPTFWNVMIANNPPYVDEFYLDEPYFKDYVKGRLDPGIIHFCGGVYYRYPFLPDMKRFFWKYAMQSPYFEEIITEMISLKLPKNDMQNKELDAFRQEFQKTHFPNINEHFFVIEHNEQLLFVMNHRFYFNLKKILYLIQKYFFKGAKRIYIQNKYVKIDQLLSDSKNLKHLYRHVL